MRTETIGEYEIEYSGVQMPDRAEWAAHLAIYGPSSNPMHLSNVFPDQRVSDALFPTEEAAESEARRIAIAMLDQGMHKTFEVYG